MSIFNVRNRVFGMVSEKQQAATCSKVQFLPRLYFYFLIETYISNIPVVVKKQFYCNINGVNNTGKYLEYYLCKNLKDFYCQIRGLLRKIFWILYVYVKTKRAYFVKGEKSLLVNCIQIRTYIIWIIYKFSIHAHGCLKIM